MQRVKTKRKIRIKSDRRSIKKIEGRGRDYAQTLMDRI